MKQRVERETRGGIAAAPRPRLLGILYKGLLKPVKAEKKNKANKFLRVTNNIQEPRRRKGHTIALEIEELQIKIRRNAAFTLWDVNLDNQAS